MASVDFREDVVGSEQLMQRVAESYRKIRNTFRYLLGNLYDFDPQKDAVSFDELDRSISTCCGRPSAMAADVTRWYDEFAFHKIYHRINDFCVVELSAFYFDVLKDRLYTSAPNSRARRAAQTAIWRIGEALVRLLRSDHELHLRGSVAVSAARCRIARQACIWQPSPTHADILGGSVPADDPQTAEDWSTLLAVRDEVLKALEEARHSKLIGGATWRRKSR